MKQTHARALIITLAVLALSVMAAACVSEPAAPTLTPAVSPTIVPSPTVQPESTGAADAAAAGDGSIAAAADGVATAVVGRTPVPTQTPGVIDKGIETVTDATGLTGKSFLGLQMSDWIGVGISIGIILLGFLVIKLIFHLIKTLLKRSNIHRGKAFFLSISTQLEWLILLLVARYAILQLDFLSDPVRTVINDLFFVLGLALLTAMSLKLIDAVVNDYKDRLDTQAKARMAPVLTAVLRGGQLILLIFALSLGLSHFGISTNVLSATVIIVGVIIALGARDIIGDAISGFIILTDQPFRVGDAIYIKDLERRGDVLEIGARTTRILTEYNREVIIPNSKIGESEVINYAYPDPNYRLESDISVPYDADMDQVQQVLDDAVRGIDGVMPDKPVDVLFLGYGDYARSISVRWWIASYEQEWAMLDKVNRAMQVALNNVGIAIPFPRYDLNVLNEGEDTSKTTPPPPDNPPNSTNS